MGSLDCTCGTDDGSAGLLAIPEDRPGIGCVTDGLMVLTFDAADPPADVTDSIQIDAATGALWAPKSAVVVDDYGRTDWTATIPYPTAASHITGPSPITTGGFLQVSTDTATLGTPVLTVRHVTPDDTMMVKVTVGAQVHLQSGSTAGDGIQARLVAFVTGNIAAPLGESHLLDFFQWTSKTASSRRRFLLRGEFWVALAGNAVSPTPDYLTVQPAVEVQATGHNGTALSLDSMWAVAEMN